MKLRNVMALALVAVLGLSGCGAKAEKATQSTESKAADAASTKVIRVGTTGKNEPYSLISSDNKWTGIEAELWDEVGKRTGYKIEMVQIPDMSALFGELGSDRIDVAANCWAITQKRLDTYLASDPIYADAQVIAVKDDSSYKTVDDLNGKKIGVTAGQAAQVTIEEMAKDHHWNVITYEDTNAGLQDLALGRVDAYAHTVTTIKKTEAGQGLKFRMLDQKLFGNNVGWFFQNNEKGQELRKEMNQQIANMQKDGTISKIVTKWFNEDATKLISDDYLKANR